MAHRVGELAVVVALSVASLLLSSTATAEDCRADRAWFENPTAPSQLDVGDYLDNCDVASYSWQLFAGLMQQVGGRALFESFAAESTAFPAQGKPPSWPEHSGSKAASGVIQLTPHLRRGTVEVHVDEVLQAGTQAPLVDQNRRWVHYNSQFNRKSYDYVRACDLYREGCFNAVGAGISFPADSMLLKAAWRVVETCTLPDSPKPCTPEDTTGLYVTRADINPYGPDLGAVHDVAVALVGLHIVTKPVNHPEWVWATFEFIGNAPDCAAVAGAGANGKNDNDWLFFDPNCEGPFCQANVYCDPCSGACGADVTLDPECKATPIPTQVCRYYPIDTMNPSGTVGQLNASVAGVAPGDSIFGHYQLVGALYTQYGSTGGNDSGSPFLANLTMETYKQDDHRIGIPPNTGCFTCHSRVFTALGTKNGGQGDFSHAFKNIQQTGACSASLPSYCPSSGLLGKQLPDG